MMKELRDQSAHFAAGLLIIVVANLLGAEIGPVVGALITFWGGLIREITEEGEVSLAALKRALHSRLDLSFWTLGGLGAGII